VVVISAVDYNAIVLGALALTWHMTSHFLLYSVITSAIWNKY